MTRLKPGFLLGLASLTAVIWVHLHAQTGTNSSCESISGQIRLTAECRMTPNGHGLRIVLANDGDGTVSIPDPRFFPPVAIDLLDAAGASIPRNMDTTGGLHGLGICEIAPTMDRYIEFPPGGRLVKDAILEELFKLPGPGIYYLNVEAHCSGLDGSRAPTISHLRMEVAK